MKKQDGISLIQRIASRNNMWSAHEKVKANKGAPGIDGVTVEDLEEHIAIYGQYI